MPDHDPVYNLSNSRVLLGFGRSCVGLLRGSCEGQCPEPRTRSGEKPIWRLGGSCCPKLRTLEQGLLGMDSCYPGPLGHAIRRSGDPAPLGHEILRSTATGSRSPAAEADIFRFCHRQHCPETAQGVVTQGDTS